MMRVSEFVVWITEFLESVGNNKLTEEQVTVIQNKIKQVDERQ